MHRIGDKVVIISNAYSANDAPNAKQPYHFFGLGEVCTIKDIYSQHDGCIEYIITRDKIIEIEPETQYVYDFHIRKLDKRSSTNRQASAMLSPDY